MKCLNVRLSRWNAGATEKVFYNQRSIHISSPQVNIVASIQEFLEIFSEVIEGSKYGPLVMIKKQTVSWHPYKWSKMKDQNQIMAYSWTFGKHPLKLEKTL